MIDLTHFVICDKNYKNANFRLEVSICSLNHFQNDNSKWLKFIHTCVECELIVRTIVLLFSLSVRFSAFTLNFYPVSLTFNMKTKIPSVWVNAFNSSSWTISRANAIIVELTNFIRDKRYMWSNVKVCVKKCLYIMS